MHSVVAGVSAGVFIGHLREEEEQRNAGRLALADVSGFPSSTSLSNGIHDVGQLEAIAKPLSLTEMLEHRARADIYPVY